MSYKIPFKHNIKTWHLQLQKSNGMCDLWLKLITWLPSPNDHVVNPDSRISHNHINDYNSPWL